MAIVALQDAGVWYAMATGFASGYVATGTFKGGVIGAFSAGVSFGIANTAGLENWQRVGLQATTGGVVESLSGGNFGHGFLAAGLTASVMPHVGKIGNDVTRTAVGALVGGTLSVATGGKFANGAMTGAIQGAMTRSVKLNAGVGKSPGDPVKAARLMNEANEALTDSGFYKRVAAGDFRSERDIAQAWGEIVGPIANRIGAEAGAWISRLPNGSYTVGGVYSDGAFDNVDAGLARAPRFRTTAFVHTHPYLEGGQYLSHQYVVGGVSALGDVVHPGEGDMSWAIDNGKRIYSFGRPTPMLRMFDPALWESQQVPGGGLTKMCLYTIPMGCP